MEAWASRDVDLLQVLQGLCVKQADGGPLGEGHPHTASRSHHVGYADHRVLVNLHSLNRGRNRRENKGARGTGIGKKGEGALREKKGREIEVVTLPWEPKWSLRLAWIGHCRGKKNACTQSVLMHLMANERKLVGVHSFFFCCYLTTPLFPSLFFKLKFKTVCMTYPDSLILL